LPRTGLRGVVGPFVRNKGKEGEESGLVGLG
jgi:hypothetical protein